MERVKDSCDQITELCWFKYWSIIYQFRYLSRNLLLFFSLPHFLFFFFRSLISPNFKGTPSWSYPMKWRQWNCERSPNCNFYIKCVIELLWKDFLVIARYRRIVSELWSTHPVIIKPTANTLFSSVTVCLSWHLSCPSQAVRFLALGALSEMLGCIFLDYWILENMISIRC